MIQPEGEDPRPMEPGDYQDLVVAAIAALAAELPASPETGLAKDSVLQAVRDRLPAALAGGRLKAEVVNPAGVPVSVESSSVDYTQTLVSSGAAAGLPATRTYTSGPEAGKTTTWTYDPSTGGVLAKVTA
jgi:hypothetical protein